MKKFLFILAVISFSFTTNAQERFITTSDGIKLYVNVNGKGPACLYLHGGPGSGSYWFEKFFGEFMEQHFTMIYLDQRGVGRSSGEYDADYSIERMALDFEEVRNALGYEQWFTVGHSFGGILQMGYQEKFPNAIKGMMMINCTLDIKESFCESWGPKAAEFTGIVNNNTCDTREDVIASLNNHIQNLRAKDLFWKMGYSAQENEKIIDATYNKIPNWNGSFGNNALSVNDYWKDYTAATATIKIPVLFFYGNQDWMVGPNHYKRIIFPKQILRETSGGHMPFIEKKPELEQAIIDYKKEFKI